LSTDDLTAIKSLAKGTVFKIFENLTTTITNWATSYSATIRSFVVKIYSVLETIKKELCKREN